MLEDYTQPFFVGVNNERFPHRDAYGYLLALEPKEIPDEADKVELYWGKSQWDYIRQLKAQMLFLSNKVNEMRDKASKRTKYTIK